MPRLVRFDHREYSRAGAPASLKRQPRSSFQRDQDAAERIAGPQPTAVVEAGERALLNGHTMNIEGDRNTSRNGERFTPMSSIAAPRPVALRNPIRDRNEIYEDAYIGTIDEFTGRLCGRARS
jgi:hypothetical protein